MITAPPNQKDCNIYAGLKEKQTDDDKPTLQEPKVVSAESIK
jgi:hypothetical protein